MPISSAAPRSSDTQRMALPSFVLDVNSVSVTMMMTLAAMVNSVAEEIFSCPSRKLLPLMNVVGKDLGFAPQIISAMFCSR